MPSVIDVFEQQITARLNEARSRIAANGDVDGELDAALRDIHGWCRKTDEDVRMMVESCW